MAEPDPLIPHAVDLLSSVGEIVVKRMFGGWGLSLEGLNLGFLLNGKLYLKADAQSLPLWEAAGCEPFTYQGKGRIVVVKYLVPPEAAMESPAEMAPWARLALEAALRARAAKPAGRPRLAPPRKGEAADQAARKSARKAPAKAARTPSRKRATPPPRTR